MGNGGGPFLRRDVLDGPHRESHIEGGTLALFIGATVSFDYFIEVLRVLDSPESAMKMLPCVVVLSRPRPSTAQDIRLPFQEPSSTI